MVPVFAIVIGVGGDAAERLRHFAAVTPLGPALSSTPKAAARDGTIHFPLAAAVDNRRRYLPNEESATRP